MVEVRIVSVANEAADYHGLVEATRQVTMVVVERGGISATGVPLVMREDLPLGREIEVLEVPTGSQALRSG